MPAIASLREAFDYVLVGPGGELPADVATAGTLARRLFDLRADAVLDISELPPPAQTAFVSAFCAGLMTVKREDGHPTIMERIALTKAWEERRRPWCRRSGEGPPGSWRRDSDSCGSTGGAAVALQADCRRRQVASSL